MNNSRRHFRLTGVLLAATMLQACMVLEEIDGPYIPPSQMNTHLTTLATPHVNIAGTGTPATPQAAPALASEADSTLTKVDPTLVGPVLPAQEPTQIASSDDAASDAELFALPETRATAREQLTTPAFAAPALARPTPAPSAPTPSAPAPSVLAPSAPAATETAPLVIPASPAESVGEASVNPVSVEQPITARAEVDLSGVPRDVLERETSALGISIAGRQPAPSAAARSLIGPVDGEPYRAFYDFTVAKLSDQYRGASRESMLLVDAPNLDPSLQVCSNQPAAVLLDLDPANGLMPLAEGVTINFALGEFLADLRRRGVTVYWITGHGPNAASSIRQRLAESALDPEGADPLIVTRFAGESKQSRRRALGESNCLLAIAGDQRGDFDELYDFILDPTVAAPLERHVDNGWFLAPPPIN